LNSLSSTKSILGISVSCVYLVLNYSLYKKWMLGNFLILLILELMLFLVILLSSKRKINLDPFPKAD